MKLKIDHPTASHAIALISWALVHVRGDALNTAIMHEQLLPFSDRLRGPWHRKHRTLNVNSATLGCLRNAMAEAAVQLADTPSAPSVMIVLEFVLSPLLKQVAK